jgi:hypothetical protein
MSDMLDRMEILIGKSLDGELSPRERRRLEDNLQRDSHARELFEQMRVLHECTCGVVTEEILGRGADPAAVFERAWQQNNRSFWRRVAERISPRKGWRFGAQADVHLRFVAGVAAGLLLGLVLNLVSVSPTKMSGDVPPWPKKVARNVPPGGGEPVGIVPVSQAPDPGPLDREVDWYVYTDRAGNHWLIEGTREGMVKAVAERGDL